MADFNPRPTQWIMRLTDADRQTHPVFGIMGGTWPRANPVFSLPAGTRKPTTNAATTDLVQDLGLSQPFVISPTTGGVCLLDDDTGTLCGAVCAVSTTMNRHMFSQHPAQIVPYRGPNPGPHDPQAIYLSERALYKFVLDGVWKDAVFLREPGNPPSTLIVQIAQWLEHLAETDENFDVALYGDKFLRQFNPVPMKALPQHRTRSKRKPANRRDGDDEHDTPRNKRSRATRGSRVRITAR